MPMGTKPKLLPLASTGVHYNSPPRGSNSQPSDHRGMITTRLKSLTLYPIELGGHWVFDEKAFGLRQCSVSEASGSR